jgi:chorismate--pyruvate lyase
VRKPAAASYATPLLPLDLWVRGDDYAGRLPAALSGWLTEPGLLTDRIQAASGAPVAVRVVEERIAFLSAEQQAILEAPASSCFARRIELVSAGRPWVYAETLIPDHTLELHPWLAELGDSSLGATLAACQDLVRGPFEFAPLPDSHPLAVRALAHAASRAAVVWARRSWFALAGRRLLVQEVFLPETAPC